MITILEHTIDNTIIDKNGFILDLGCVNFSFSLAMKQYCNNVICVDPNPKIINVPNGLIYENACLVNDDKTEVEFFLYNDTNGHSMLNPEHDWCKLINSIKVNAINLPKLMLKYNIKQFELIKFDIEGGEYDILNNIDWTISKQYSIEFHDFRGMNPFYPNNEKYYENLLNKLSPYCDVIQHKMTAHPGFPINAGNNYWDSLFVTKKEYWK